MLVSVPRQPDWDTAGLFDGPVAILNSYLRTLEQRLRGWGDEMEPEALKVWQDTLPMLRHLVSQITCDDCQVKAAFVPRGDGEFYCAECDEARYTTCEICHRDLPTKDAISAGAFHAVHLDCCEEGAS